MKKVIPIVLFVFVSNLIFGQADKPIYEIHAQMVHNFIKYIQWPNENEGGNFVVGVFGDDDIFNTLIKWYEGKPKGTKKFVIKKLNSVMESSSCDVIYVGKFKNREFGAVKLAIEGKPILTITDGVGLAQKGSCINFKEVEGRLKFELNKSSVSSANLKVSNQLSSMAIVI